MYEPHQIYLQDSTKARRSTFLESIISSFGGFWRNQWFWIEVIIRFKLIINARNANNIYNNNIYNNNIYNNNNTLHCVDFPKWRRPSRKTRVLSASPTTGLQVWQMNCTPQPPRPCDGDSTLPPIVNSYSLCFFLKGGSTWRLVANWLYLVDLEAHHPRINNRNALIIQIQNLSLS